MATLLATAATFVLGLLAGGMLLVGVAFVPYWRALPPLEFVAWFQANAHLIGRVMIPLGTGAAVLALAAAIAAWRAAASSAHWLAVAAGLVLVVDGMYLTYFTAANTAFESGALSADQVTAELATWPTWHWVRTSAGALAFLAALRGLTVSQR